MSDPRAHVIIMPKNFVVLRSFQLAIAVILFAFGIFGAIYAPVAGVILTLVTSICTIVIAGYTIGAQRAENGKAYNYWAVMALEIFLVIFWLISFALLAATLDLVRAYYYDPTYYTYTYTYYAKRDMYTSGVTAGMAIMGLAVGLGAVEFVLYIVSLVILSIRIHRHRKAGGHCKPADIEHAAPQAHNPKAAEQSEKIAMQPQTQAYPVQTEPYYPPQ